MTGDALDLAVLVRMHNASPEFHPAIQALVESAPPAARVRERARYLRLLAAMLEGDIRTLPRRVWERMKELRHRYVSAKWLTIDLATVDGVILALMLLEGFKVPHRSTLQRALEARPASARTGLCALADLASLGDGD